MPAPPLANTFNGGTDGVLVTAANSGGASGNAFDVVQSSIWNFTNVQSHSGGIAIRAVDAAVGGWMEWDGLGSLTTAIFFRWYMYISAYPTTNRHYALAIRNSAGSACGFIRIFTSGVVSAADASNSGFGADGSVGIALDQWVRLEARCVASTTVGELGWRLYNSPDSTTISDSASGTGLTLAANVDQVWYGLTTAPFPAVPYTSYIDDVAVSTTDWIGPSQTARPVPLPPTPFLDFLG